jgi:hypothetical protein
MTSHTHHFTDSALSVYPKVFVVRLWEEPQTASPSVWRASVHHPESGLRWHFSGPNELAQFLLETDSDRSLIKDAFP